MQGYFTTPISENVEETPEGFLIARDCVLARTGWQKYQVRDLPAAKAADLGVDLSNPEASIELYRPAEEVFNPDTMCSAEGKPVTDGHPSSPDGFVHPDNFAEFSRGHIQHIHPGEEPLESGDLPLLGDVHITAEPLLSKVRNHLARELSLGYDYSIRKVGDRIEQCDFVINHAAVVPRARAGPEARINDAAPPSASESPPTPVVQTTPVPTPTLTLTKEKRPVKNKVLHLLGLGLMERARAQDADPEELAELAEAAMEIGRHQEAPAQSPPTAEDARKRSHDAFDRLMDGKATDADMEELGKWLKEEEKEPEHQADTSELEEVLASDDSDCVMDAGDPDEGAEVPGEGEAEPSGEEEEVPGADSRGRAADAVEGAKAVLKLWRPHAARAKDGSPEQAAFNAALRAVTRSSRASTGGYGSFATTARARDRATVAPRTTPTSAARARAADARPDDSLTKLQKYYNDSLKGAN